MTTKPNLVKTCYNKSKALLLKNSSPHGFLAAAPSAEAKAKNYLRIFGRDASICALGALASGETKLIKFAQKSLATLAEFQGEMGQIPFSVNPKTKEVNYWMPGSVDNNCWWLLACLAYFEKTKDQEFQEKYQENINRAFTWLRYQDQNSCGLIEQGFCSDWADIMPRHGAVLFTNTLWYKTQELYAKYFQDSKVKKASQLTKEGINSLLWIWRKSTNNTNYLPKNSFFKKSPDLKYHAETTNNQLKYLPYYIEFISHETFGHRFDVFANILALIFNVNQNKQQLSDIVEYVWQSNSNKPYPVKVLYPPIYPGEKQWQDFMTRRRQNLPWQYHNGGIWPYVGGFWVYLLAKTKDQRAKQELENLAQANAVNDWEFNEYFHGSYGTPMGIKGQSWNAATFILAYQALNNKLFIV